MYVRDFFLCPNSNKNFNLVPVSPPQTQVGWVGVVIFLFTLPPLPQGPRAQLRMF